LPDSDEENRARPIEKRTGFADAKTGAVIEKRDIKYRDNGTIPGADGPQEQSGQNEPGTSGRRVGHASGILKKNNDVNRIKP